MLVFNNLLFSNPPLTTWIRVLVDTAGFEPAKTKCQVRLRQMKLIAVRLFRKPPTGIEPVALRSRVVCSTNWAKEAYVSARNWTWIVTATTWSNNHYTTETLEFVISKPLSYVALPTELHRQMPATGLEPATHGLKCCEILLRVYLYYDTSRVRTCASEENRA